MLNKESVSNLEWQTKIVNLEGMRLFCCPTLLSSITSKSPQGTFHILAFGYFLCIASSSLQGQLISIEMCILPSAIPLFVIDGISEWAIIWV